MTHQNILLATDLSESSSKMVLHIGPLIKQLDGQLSLIHVVKSYFSDWISSHEVERVAQQRLEHFIDKLKEDGTKTGSVYVEVGNVAERVLFMADSLNIDMIIIGAEDKSKLKKIVFGASAEAIVRHARQNVWIHKTESFKGIHKIICGVDFSPSSKHALAKALSMAKTFSAKLIVLHVIHDPNFEAIGVPVKIEEEKLEAYKKQKAEELETFVQEFDTNNVNIEKYVLWGGPSHEILDYAEDENVDLIVLGEKGNDHLKRIVLGGTAERVMRAAPCSMLVCR